MLGLAMAVIAVVNALLMAWLWSFPMKPDPGGKDPHGVSTAPRSWTNVHRALGYIFVLIYVALLFEMVPRLWEFRVFSAVTVIHAILGALVGLLLAVKIAIIRRFQRFGGNLPWIGGSLAATAVVMNGIAIVPAWMALRPLTSMTPELAAGRDVVAAKCFQCHGASTIVSEREDARKWDRLTRKMQRFSSGCRARTASRRRSGCSRQHIWRACSAMLNDATNHVDAIAIARRETFRRTANKNPAKKWTRRRTATAGNGGDDAGAIGILTAVESCGRAALPYSSRSSYGRNEDSNPRRNRRERQMGSLPPLRRGEQVAGRRRLDHGNVSAHHGMEGTARRICCIARRVPRV
jgi:hypothetical protein